MTVMISQTRTRHPDDGEKMMRCPYSGTTNSTLLQRRHCSCCCTSCTLLHLLLLQLLLLHLLLLDLLQRCSYDLEFCRQCSSGLLSSLLFCFSQSTFALTTTVELWLYHHRNPPHYHHGNICAMEKFQTATMEICPTHQRQNTKTFCDSIELSKF